MCQKNSNVLPCMYLPLDGEGGDNKRCAHGVLIESMACLSDIFCAGGVVVFFQGNGCSVGLGDCYALWQWAELYRTSGFSTEGKGETNLNALEVAKNKSMDSPEAPFSLIRRLFEYMLNSASLTLLARAAYTVVLTFTLLVPHTCSVLL
jgi:hypothetical protein